MNKVKDFILSHENVFCRKVFFIFLIIINLAGTIYGMYWYWGQLQATWILAWPVVPDSPTATLLFAVYLIVRVCERELPLLRIISCGWLLKYGIWAVIINLHYGYLTGCLRQENILLILSHLGMALEGILFLWGISFRRKNIALLFFLMLFSDLMDYVFDLHPYLFDERQRELALLSAFFLTCVLNFIFFRRTRTLLNCPDDA